MFNMFITVRFGDCQQALFNPNCRTKLLLENIKLRCSCKGVTVDLSDERGLLRNLPDHLASYANELLKERETFILVKVEKQDGQESPIYTPLLTDDATVTSEFLEQLTRTRNGGLEVSGRHSRTRKSSTSVRPGKGRSAGTSGNSTGLTPVTRTRKASTSRRDK